MWTRRGFLELPIATALASCLGDNLHPQFRWGVASGDPTPSSIVLWTRCATSGALVEWAIAEDAAMSRIVARGEAIAEADHDDCLKILVEGLEPDRTYHYQFSYGGYESTRGRTRTAPQDRARLRFAIASCASLSHGYFHLYRDLAERDDLDAVIFVGDYIYEHASGRYGKVRAYEPPTELLALDDYRERYRQYRSDADLQALHAAHPMIAIWDDHEIANDAFATGSPVHDPATGPYADRLEAALRAYMENLPIAGFDARTCRRSLDYGTLAELVLFDMRTERDPAATGFGDLTLMSDTRRVIGEAQEAFVVERLRDSPARWRLLCQTTMFAPRLHDDELASWQWDGYPRQRERLLSVIGERPGVIILGGDLHSAWAIDLANTVELICPGITSPNLSPQIAAQQYEAIAARNKPVRYVDLVRRGYVLLELDPDTARATFVHIDDVRDPVTATITTSAVLASAHAAPGWTPG